MDNLYRNDPHETDYDSGSHANILSAVHKIDRKCRKLRKKKRGGKGSRKKLKKRIKRLKKEREKLLSALAAKQNSPWWRGALEKTLPEALKFASAIVKCRPQPQNHIQHPPLGKQFMYCLPDNSKD